MMQSEYGMNNNKVFTGERLIRNDSIYKPMRTENLARFGHFANEFHGKTILDLGCGVGEGSDYIASLEDWSVCGVDISLESIFSAEREKKEDQVFFAQMDVTRLGFKDCSFDGICSIEVIEHISDPIVYLHEAYRVLKSGGVFMLTTPNRLISSPKAGTLWPDHVREYSPQEIINLISNVFLKYKMEGEFIPKYERNIFRKLVHKISPFVKPFLPKFIRIRALPLLQTTIQSDIKISDVVFTNKNIEQLSTLVVFCYKE